MVIAGKDTLSTYVWRVYKYPRSDHAAPSNKGPRVITVQYNVILVAIWRGLVTLNIKLKLFSMVDNSKMAVIAKPATPTVVS